MGGPLYFALSSVLLAHLANRYCLRALPRARASTKLLAFVLLWIAGSNLILLGLGSVNFLRPWSPTLVCLLWALLDHLFVRRAETPAHEPACDGGEDAGLGRLPLALIGGLFAWWMGRTLGVGTGFVWDDLAYHAVMPAWWATQGALELVPYNYQGYYPANAELLTLWFILPLGNDALANAAVFLWGALILLAAVSMAEEHRASGWLLAAVLACLLASPELNFFVNTISANDLAVAALGLSMLALAWRRESTATGSLAFMCGVAAGLLLGTKVSAAPQIACVGLWWLLGMQAGVGRWKGFLAFGAGLLAFGSFWYVRNLMLTGNPVFPAQLGPFDGPLDPESARKTTLLPSIESNWKSLSFWGEFLRLRLNWPLPLGLASMAGYGVGAFELLRRGKGRANARPHLALLLIVGMIFLMIFPMQPFSGTNNRPGSDLHDLIRYLCWPFALGLVSLALAIGRHRLWSRLACILVLIALVASEPATKGMLWILVGVSATLAGTFVWARLAQGLRLRGHWATLSVAVLCGGLCIGSGPKWEAIGEELYLFSTPDDGRGRDLGPTWRAIEDLPPGSNLALISHDPSSHDLLYPLFGRDLQQRVVSIEKDGTRHLPLHTTWRQQQGGWWWAFKDPRAAGSGQQLVANLLQSGVHFLVISKWPRKQTQAKSRAQAKRYEAWPPARELLLNHLGPSGRIYADAYGEIWQVGEAMDAHQKVNITK